MKRYPSQAPELVRERNRLYREANRDKLIAYDAARYAKRYEERKKKGMTEEQKEARRARSRNWRAKNRKHSRELARNWRNKHPDYVAPGATDREAINAKWRAAYSNRADYYRKKSREKRVRKAGAPGAHTDQEWFALVAYFRHACVYCGDVVPLTRDHIIPLSRTELHPTNDIANILPACAPCNSRKKDRTDGEYRRWLSIRGPLCSLPA